MSIHLTHDPQRALDDEARPETETSGTLADLLEGCIGLEPGPEYPQGTTNFSERTGQRFTELLVERRKQRQKRR